MTGEMGRSLQGLGEIRSPFQGRNKLPRQKRRSDSPISFLGIIEGLPHARRLVGSWGGGGRLWRWEMVSGPARPWVPRQPPALCS